MSRMTDHQPVNISDKGEGPANTTLQVNRRPVKVRARDGDAPECELVPLHGASRHAGTDISAVVAARNDLLRPLTMPSGSICEETGLICCAKLWRPLRQAVQTPPSDGHIESTLRVIRFPRSSIDLTKDKKTD